MNRLNVLLSAYACEPNRGSEPGVGWNMAGVMARYHNVTVLTRTKARPLIEAALAQHPIPNLRFLYFDLPPWAKWWKRGQRGIQLYYYLWQIGAYFVAKEALKKEHFDLIHHVTFGKYWAPSLLALLPPPFVLGPVGGGESAPRSFLESYGPWGVLYESMRDAGRWVGEHDPLVRLMIRRSQIALVATPETRERLEALQAREIRHISGQTGLNQGELEMLGRLALPATGPCRFISLGRLIHWKGIHLALRAFARAGLASAEYWIIGEGPEAQRLRALATELNVAERVHFWGNLPRAEAWEKLGQCHALIHPSVHDFSPTACLEAMAAGRPVLCLNLGGPAVQVTDRTGFKVDATNPETAISGLAAAMVEVASDAEKLSTMSVHARERVRAFSWDVKAEQVNDVYQRVVAQNPVPPPYA